MDSIQPNQRLQMPINTAYRKIDMNANNKIDQIFTVEKETCDIYRFADFNEDGFVDLMTDYERNKDYFWDENGNMRELDASEKTKGEGAFGTDNFMMSQRVLMPTENIFVGNDFNKTGKYEQIFTIAEDTGWIVQYQDKNEDGIADKLYNYGNRVALEWKEDGTCTATNLNDYSTQTDLNGDNIADEKTASPLNN